MSEAVNKEFYDDEYEESLVTQMFIYERLKNTEMLEYVTKLFDEFTSEPDGHIIDD